MTPNFKPWEEFSCFIVIAKIQKLYNDLYLQDIACTMYYIGLHYFILLIIWGNMSAPVIRMKGKVKWLFIEECYWCSR